MGQIVALPAHGDVLLDVRGDGRAMRASWHQEGRLLNLSLWRAGTCVGTLQLAREDVPALVAALVTGLADTSPDVGRATAVS
jgi:hypothetical protein